MFYSIPSTGLAITIILLARHAGAVNNGLAITPQMGWNTWNSFGCDSSQDLLLSTAQQIVALGFKDLGYNYVLQDDCWSAGRNSTGHLQANTTKFPDGMAYVADQLHAMNLSFGIYSDAGSLTCGQYIGSLGNETIDAQTWASWGVDYLKYDNCYNEGQSASFPDRGVTGAWNDMDMLGLFQKEVGNGGMTDEEYVTHFSMWAALKSPLIMGNDLRKITPSALSILSNPAVLAVSQDPGSSGAFRRWRYFVPDTDLYGQGEIQLWSASLSGGDALVVLLNGGSAPREMNATLEDIFWNSGPGGTAPQVAQGWDVYDLWGNRMDNATATQIINAANQTAASNSTSPSNATDPGTIGTQFRYNATAMGGYASGLAQNLSVLLGKKIGSVEPRGNLVATVPSHGVGMFRLRQQVMAAQPLHHEL
ncbi:hypothetical protein EW145_g192 [Phellinidium pouzarii]|uniref:Alpha-galactosidase n=1 Tax=Phellinidium pouzarii TaxID=167371 RepID=A0A4S4LL75_9AGAM|nr:hypothetical protein EW145_g192 [Phellinidium pouzarii]